MFQLYLVFHLVPWVTRSLTSLLSADGIVRLYRNYDPDTSLDPVQMVSSFRALTEVTRMKRGTGLVTSWKQHDGHLLVSGDSHVVKVWDGHTESLVLVSAETYSNDETAKENNIGFGYMHRCSRHGHGIRRGRIHALLGQFRKWCNQNVRPTSR